jgi:hypothetical protein
VVFDVGSDVNVLEGFRPALSRHNEPVMDTSPFTFSLYSSARCLGAHRSQLAYACCPIPRNSVAALFSASPIPAVMTLDRN